MLSAIGITSLDSLFEQIPPAVRLEGGLDLPDGVSELEIVDDLRSLAARDRHLDDLVCFAGAGSVRPLHPRGGVGAGLPFGVLDVVHAVPAGAVARRPAGPLRVPIDGLRAHRSGGVERLPLRRCDGARGSREHGAERSADAGPRVRGGRSETGRDVAHVRQGVRLRARDLRIRGRQGRNAARGRRRRCRGGPASQRARDPRAGHRALLLGEGGGCEGDPGLRPPVARCARASRGARRRYRGGRGAVPGEPPRLRRPVPGTDRRQDDGRPSDAGPHRGRDRGRRRRPRIRAHAPSAGAAHPAREGQLEHLHEPDADGRGGDDLPGLARAGGAGGDRAPLRGQGLLRRRPAHRDRRRVAAAPGRPVLQGVRAAAPGPRGSRSSRTSRIEGSWPVCPFLGKGTTSCWSRSPSGGARSRSTAWPKRWPR